MLHHLYTPLAPGTVRPQGWLEVWEKVTAFGWTMKYARNRDVDVYGKFWNRNQTEEIVFDDNDQTITLCDYTAYFADGLVRHAVLNPGSALEDAWLEWMRQLLASQDADGYLGAFIPPARWKHWLEIFSQAVVQNALLYWYEARGDEACLRAAQRAMDCLMAAWAQPEGEVLHGIFSGHGTIVVFPATRLHQLTGERKYLDFAAEVFERYGKTDAYLTETDAVKHQHNVVETEHVGFPGVMYEHTGTEKYLLAGRRAFEMMEIHLCVDGQPHGGEMMTHIGARINCEHCSAVELFWAADAMARVTGEVKYMDMAERCMLNAYPAAKTADGEMLAYSHTPNQLVASEWSVPHNNELDVDWWASRQFFSSAHEPLCCNANSPRGIPNYLDALVNTTEKGIAVFYYGPARVAAKAGGMPVLLEMDTTYPYEDEVRITLTPERVVAFPLALRIPGWSAGGHLLVNGKSEGVTAAPGAMAVIERTWQPGDVVSLWLDNPVRVVKTRRPEFGVRSATCTVSKGALLYALPVKEDWQFYTAPAHGPGQDIVSSRVVMAKDAAWNYALIFDEDSLQSDFEPVALKTVEDEPPFGAHPPIGLRVKARRVTNWHPEGDADHVMTPGAPIMPMHLAEAVDEITLVPYGHTQLRMTYLPFVPPSSF